MSSDEQRTDSETTKRTTGSIDRLKASNTKSNKSKSSDHRQNKLAKVGKQEGIDEDEQEEETERSGDSNRENKCENASGSNQKIESNVEIINLTVERQQTVQHQSSEILNKNLLTPIRCSSLNMNTTSIPTTPTTKRSSNVSKPKLLIRSHALCLDETSDNTNQITIQNFNKFHSSLHPLSNTSSLSVDSNHDIYTDSTGIDLQAFITTTLHKNAKDRQMLLNLEQNMLKLVKDSSRHSQKFPMMSSYNRMLVHRVAAFFGLDHNVDQNGTAVVVNKTKQTRVPDIEFSSLIRNNIFTDEPRRYLKRDVQSFDEGRECLNEELLFNRRAHSFEIGDCRERMISNVKSQLPYNSNQLHINLYKQYDSSSADAINNQLIDSPSSCYSYGDLAYINNAYCSPSETAAMNNPLSSSSSNNINNANMNQSIYPWNSSSESYTSYSSSSFDQSTAHVLSPIIQPTNKQTPLFTRSSQYESNVPVYKSSNDQIGYYIEQKPSYEQCIATERAPYMGDYMNAARMSDSTDQGYNYVPNSSANQTDANILSQQQSNIYYTYNNSNIPNNTQPCAPYFVSTVPAQPYSLLSPFVQCMPNNVSSAYPIPGMTQQFQSLCLSDGTEVMPSQLYAYSLSQPQQAPIPTQQMIQPTTPLGAFYANQPCFVQVIPQDYVMTSNLNANSTTTIASPNCPPPPPSVCSPNQVESPEDIPVPDPSQTAIANNSNIEQQQYNNTSKQHF